MEPAPAIGTSRLLLRQLVLADAEALHPVLSDAALMTWWSSAPTKSLAETREYLGWNASLDPGHRCWAITRPGGQALGWAIIINKRTGVAELGYILARAAQGQGMAREAVSAVIDYGFGTMALRRIAADIDPDNVASISLVESLGFTLEGRLRGEWQTHLGVRDSLIYGLLASDRPA